MNPLSATTTVIEFQQDSDVLLTGGIEMRLVLVALCAAAGAWVTYLALKHLNERDSTFIAALALIAGIAATFGLVRLIDATSDHPPLGSGDRVLITVDPDTAHR